VSDLHGGFGERLSIVRLAVRLPYLH